MKKHAAYVLIFAILIVSIILVSSLNLDINRDGVINMTDLQILASHFQGKGTYNVSYDLNNNSKIDLFDLVSVARQIGVNSSNNSGGNITLGNESLLAGYTVNSNNVLSGPVPSGWTLVTAQGFDNGSIPGGQLFWGSSTGITSAASYTGTHSAGGTYAGDGNAVGWGLNPGNIASREAYISWWEYDEPQGKLNDEMFLMRVYTNDASNNLQQEIVFDYLGGGPFNSDTGTMSVIPQGVGGGYTHAYHMSRYGPTWGSWDQWEVYLKTSTPNIDDGAFKIFKNGVLMDSLSNINLNGNYDMTNMALEIGGVYTKLTWWNGVGSFSAPGSCTSYLGNGTDSGPRVRDFSVQCPCTNECPPNGYVPIFKRYLDDIIILRK